MKQPSSLRRNAAYVLGVAGSGLCTVFLLLTPWEQRLDTTALIYLAIVIAAAFVGGPGPGVVTAIVAFVTMNQHFIPPVGSLTVTHPGDVMAALAFLGVAGLISHLLNRSQVEATTARRREREAQIIADMVQVVEQAETLLPMLEAVVTWTVRTLGVEVCTALLPTRDGQLEGVARSAIVPGSEAGDPIKPAAAAEAMQRAEPIRISEQEWRYGYLPLLAGGKAVGVLEVASRLVSTPGSWQEERIWVALTYQVGMAIERAQLRAHATETEILRRSGELKSVLLATVSHELSTPLAVIKAAATSFVEDGAVAQPKLVHELARTIDREADHLHRLVTDLLDVSRIEGGVLRLALGWYDLGELVQEALARLRPRLGARVVEIDLADDLAPVRVDYLLISRVIDNLIGNAIRYVPQDRPVRIEIAPAGDDVEVIVADDGPGIPEHELERVFEKFHHVEGRQGGIGLGLAICKGIVEAHRGQIWAQSPLRQGRGLAIHFTLPHGRAEPDVVPV